MHSPAFPTFHRPAGAPLRVALLLIAGFLGCLARPADAATSVTAALSQNTMTVGDSIQLTVTVQGSASLTAPREVAVDGLAIRYSQRSQRSQFSFPGGASVSTELIYTIEAERPGSFTIPAMELQVDGKALKTEPVALKVETAAPGARQGGIDQIGFAELTLGKMTAYLGEIVPLELRLFIDGRISRYEVQQISTIEGDGFTKQKMPEPRREHVRRDGKDYQVIVFRTAITPSRAGKITIGPMDLTFAAQIPQPQQNRRRTPFDDLLGDAFSDDPLFSQAQVKKVTAKAPPVVLDVKLLPGAGRPKDFSGAIGEFKFSAEGSPGKVKIGDPVTMKLSVSGRGNFDRVNAPQIRDAAGWHPYPATGDFKSEDELQMSGTKIFEMAVIPEVKQSAMPVFAFSYFDPSTEKYATLTSAAAPLEVEGAALSSPTAKQDSAVGASQAGATPAPAKPVVVNDILGLRYESGERRNSFKPRWLSRNFAIGALAPAVLFLGFAGLQFRRKDDAAARVAGLQKQKAEAWRAVRRERERAGFLDAAARVLQIEAALKTGRGGHAVDAAAVRNAAEIDEATGEAVEEIFATRAELFYAGTAPGNGALAEPDRARLIAVLERFEKSHGKS